MRSESVQEIHKIFAKNLIFYKVFILSHFIEGKNRDTVVCHSQTYLFAQLFARKLEFFL